MEAFATCDFNNMVRVFFVLAAVLAVAYGFTLPKPKVVERIVGGFEIDIAQVPYQASLRLDGNHICGASIISSNWVLTASHCVVVDGTSRWSLRVGSSDHNVGGSVHQVNKVIKHPKYNTQTFDYDFALMQVDTPFQKGDRVGIIGLTAFNPSPNSKALVSGWGALYSGGPSPLHLRAVEVVVVPRNVCNNMYGGAITDRMICAGVPEGGKDSCQGDSGGPLLSDTGFLVGVVSWGKSCADAAYPGIYSSVAVARQWIRENAGV